jgi:hypothetical protein
MLAVGIEHDNLPDVDRLPVLDSADHEAVPSGIPAGRSKGSPSIPRNQVTKPMSNPSTSSPYATRCTRLDVVDGVTGLVRRRPSNASSPAEERLPML